MPAFLEQLGKNLTSIWSRLGRTQRAVLVVLTSLTVIMMVVFVSWSRTPEYAVAFKGLEAEDAAEVVARLKEQGYPYKLEENGNILVPRSAVAEVRLAMAAEGLPKGGTIGFELFDTNSLGMSEFYQEINYRRALEGELARTIASLDAVDQVRVHLVIPEKSLYTSQQGQPSASIMIRLVPGASLTKDQIRAIRFLVAGSVEGLDPNSLAIVDTQGNTLAAGTSEEAALEQALDISAQQLQIQRSYEQALEASIQSMLEQLMGPGRAVVKAQVTMNWNKVESTSETFAPGEDDGVLRSSHAVTETFRGTAESVGGIPGAATNLPPSPDSPMPAAEGTTLEPGDYARQEILHNYEVSRVETHSTSAPGQIERLAVSVLVDGVTDARQLADIREAVAAAAGYDPTRGDVVSVKGMPFDRSFYEAEAELMEQANRERLYVTIAKYVGLAILVVILLLYVRSLLNSLRPVPVRVESPSLLGLPESDQLAELSSQQARQLSPAEVARALQAGAETRFEPDPRLETLIRKQAKAHGSQDAELIQPGTEGAARESATIHAPVASPPDSGQGAEPEEESKETSSTREARQRLQRQVAALARSEPGSIAQVIRKWLAEGK